MTDYQLGIGGSSTMMIRDTGGSVEFWFRTGSQTWNNDQWWSWSANGTGARSKFRLLRGGNWQLFGAVYVTYDQNVSFTIEGAGLGWATTTFTQHIQRTTVPQAPSMNSATPISSSTIHVVFHGNYDGGSPVLEWQIGYGTSSNGPTATVGSGGISDVGGFYSGQRVYFWARARNSLGWSSWSNRLEATTWQVPAAPNQPTFQDIAQTSVGVNFSFTSRQNDPPILEKEFGYSKNPLAVVYDGVVTIDTPVEYVYDLDPGETYYFWGRARNSVGWGSWSTGAKLILIAGARVLVAGTWKRAVPYVNVGGVWKVSEPWIKEAGIWKKTSI